MNKMYVIAAAGVVLVGAAIAVSSKNDSISQTVVGKQDSHDKKAPKAPQKSRWFKSVDTNKDGKLSNDEFHAKHEQYFQSVDVNKDGMLTPKEMKDHRDKNRAESRKGKKGSKKNPRKKTQPQQQKK